MGGCVTRAQHLTLTDDSIDETLQPGQAKFYTFDMSQQWIDRKKDLVVRVHVSKGRLERVYCARDRSFPNQRRKMWESERYCSCPSPSCDHCFPNCLNEAGGVCTECMHHDEAWTRMAHDAALGGLAQAHGQLGGGGASGLDADDDDADDVELTSAALEDEGDAEAEGGRLFDPPYPHQTDFEFSLRISPSSALDAPHARAGRYWVTVAAAPERVRRALRKQRIREGEEAYHTTLYSIWIEECAPRGDPRLGNDARVALATERARARAEVAARKRAFGRKLDQQEEDKHNKHTEEQLLREYGLGGEIAPADDLQHKKTKHTPAVEHEGVADAIATPTPTPTLEQHERSKTQTDS